MRKRRKNSSKPREVGRVYGSSSTVIVNARGPRLSFRFAENDGLIQGVMNSEHPLDFRSEYLGGHIAAALCHPAPRRALCLGLGLGAVPRLLQALIPELHIDCVEANDAVIEAAYKYFHLPRREALSVIHDLAERFVLQTSSVSSYDLVFLDCYDASGVALACTSESFFAHLTRLLTPGSLMIINLIPGRVGADQLRTQAIKHLETPWVLSCPNKSNETVFGAVSGPLNLDGVSDRARSADEEGVVPFRIEEELKRAYRIRS